MRKFNLKFKRVNAAFVILWREREKKIRLNYTETKQEKNNRVNYSQKTKQKQ